MSREKPKKIKVSVGSRIFDTVNLIFLILLGLTTFYPFWDCLVVSFSSLKSYLATNIHLWPDEWSFEGYAYMLKSFDLWRSYANSIFITVVGTLINMLITTMAAYVLSKKDLKGQRFFMFLAVFTMMFTGGIIPTYIVVKDLHLMNSLWAMILPSAVNTYNQTEEETKQTETTETGTEDVSKEKAHSKETAEKETTEEIQQDGSLYDMGGEMRKASRVAKVGLRKAAGGLDSNYVYLDTTGMNLNSNADWSTATQLYLFKNGEGTFSDGEKVTVYGKDYWRWQIDSTNGNKEFAFTYVDNWNDGDNAINRNNYYRTELAGKSSSSSVGISFSAAGGKVFARDTDASGTIGSTQVYIVKDITAEIANKMPLYFYDFTGKATTQVKVVYSSNSNFSAEAGGALKTVEMNSVTDFPNLYTVELKKEEIEAKPYVKFTDGSGKQLGEIYYFGEGGTNADAGVVPVTYKAGSVDTFLYGATELKSGDGTTITPISGWGTTPGNESLKDKTLYFDNQHFPVGKEEESQKVTLQIGSNPEETLESDPKFKNSLYSYTFTENITQQTVLTVKDPKGKIYHFFWTDLDCNLLQVMGNIANVTGDYGYGNKIYFDATYSKLNTPDGGNGGQNSIPASDDAKVYFYAWSTTDNRKYRSGEMIKAKSHEKDGQTWNDVWYVRIPEEDGIDQIIFSADALDDKNGLANNLYGRRTAILTIPGTDKCGGKPCFYADAGDTAAYSAGEYRGGYWAEAYTVRDAEKYKNSDVVNIQEKPSPIEKDTLYVDSTFYDYYTDYELNGNNRDTYPGVNVASQRNWVTFRQFDQALSDYYREKNVSIPIYTGHFQPSINDWGFQFKDINGTLKLYGSDDHNKFFSTNNSSIDVDGKDGKYAFAAQGLVNAALSNGTLMTADNKSPEPHFDEAFLLGKNSKNAVLGEVYHNVSFPFKKKEDEYGVEYWWFDSSKTTLAMQKDSSTGEYYLKNTGNQGWAQNVNSNGTTGGDKVSYGFFPFNENTTAASGKNYNYGFGTKLEIKFRLTADGTVLGDNEEKVPIIFAFSGDDDVWVFIDGKLALDVGGAHGKVTGTLDFENLKAKVSEVKKSAADGAAGDAGTNKTTDFTLKGDKQDEHTLTMFYMERGMWESNMMIAFNFPDDNEFAVEKQVDKREVNPLFVDSFEDASVFPFTIQNQATHYGAKDVESGATAKNQTFNSFESNSPELTKGSLDNTFEWVQTYQDRSGVAHWYAPLEDTTGEHKDSRFGTIPYQSIGSLDASTTKKYLDFKL